MQQRGLLLDRDGVINVDHGYVGKVEQFSFIPGLFPFLRASRDMGFKLAILTNQSGVARGKYTVGDYQILIDWMLKQLSKEGISIDLTLACFEHTEAAVDIYNRESFWRKPNPGMVLEAIQKLRLDPKRSVFLGDQPRDMEAAQAGGIGHCLWLTESKQQVPQNMTIVRSYDEALIAMRD
jgi:D-glycero-D-manno-heptose 1,7-bisphosphate phosphatase